LTVVFKFKIAVDDTLPGSKKFSLTPKNLEITNLKVLNEGQEVEMEQMMIQSVVNLQLENLKREFKEFPFYMNDLLSKNPKEMQCLGFNVADIDITFKKSQAQFSAYFKKTKYANKALCEKFFQELQGAPNKLKEVLDPAKNSALAKGMEEAQAAAAGDTAADPWAALNDAFAKGAAASQAAHG